MVSVVVVRRVAERLDSTVLTARRQRTGTTEGEDTSPHPEGGGADGCAIVSVLEEYVHPQGDESHHWLSPRGGCREVLSVNPVM
jgi:hypothetical protein